MEEKKTYSVVGTVTIGTDEYRDLIEAVAAAKAESEKYRDYWWKEKDKVSSLEKKLEAATAELETVKNAFRLAGRNQSVETGCDTVEVHIH